MGLSTDMVDTNAPSAWTDVPAHFRRNAPQDAHQVRRHRAVLALLKEVSGEVLDYGCGYGDLTYAMSRTHPNVIGVDVDPQRIAFARHEYPELRFEVCPPDGLTFADASFDVVTSVVVLPFVPDANEYLREVHRVLRPGGHLVVATKTWPLLRRVYRRLRYGPRTAGPRVSSLTLHSVDAIAALLETSGFAVLRRNAFYDPPFSNHKNFADLLNGSVELAGEALGLVEPAPYPLLLARRAES
jgi:ubiquinone/menaquinone biosynthesis C-methylase UbiE